MYHFAIWCILCPLGHFSLARSHMCMLTIICASVLVCMCMYMYLCDHMFSCKLVLICYEWYAYNTVWNLILKYMARDTYTATTSISYANFQIHNNIILFKTKILSLKRSRD